MSQGPTAGPAGVRQGQSLLFHYWMQEPSGCLVTSHRMILRSAIPCVVNFPNFSWNGPLLSKQDSATCQCERCAH